MDRLMDFLLDSACAELAALALRVHRKRPCGAPSGSTTFPPPGLRLEIAPRFPQCPLTRIGISRLSN
jgi:hypothetical protein